jgi:hypothetical protein
MKTCVRCGTSHEGSHAYYCAGCFNEYQRIRNEGPVDRRCDFCRTTMVVATEWSKRRYCKPSCKAKHGEAYKMDRRFDAKLRRMCEECGSPVPTTRRADSVTCSEPCATKRRRRLSPEQTETTRRRLHLRREFGLSPGQYAALLAAQDGGCAICGATEPGKGRYMHVDHCHSNGGVRGLLCASCNLGLGKFKDDTDVLARAIDYLNRHRLE